MFGVISCSLLLAILCVGTLRKPAVAFAAVLCLYGLKQWGQNSSALLVQNRTVMNISVAVLVLLALVRDWRNSFEYRSISITWWYGLLLYSYAFLSLLWVPNFKEALEQWGLQIPYVLMIAVTAPLLIKDLRSMRVAAEWTLMIGGAICILALVFGKWGGRGLLVVGDFFRSETNPLAIASLGGTVCVIAMMSTMASVHWSKRILHIVLAMAGLAVILRSGSRGQLLAAIAAVVVGMPMAAKKRNIGAWITIFVLVIAFTQVGWWIWDQLGVNSSRWSGKRSGEDVESRLTMATTLLSAACKNPATLVFGLGNSSSFFYIGFYPHVALLEVLAEEGLIGFCLYVMVAILTVRNIFVLDNKARRRADHASNHVVATLTALFVFEWILTFKQGSLLSSVYVIAYAAILGSLYKQGAEPLSADDVLPASSERPLLELSNLMR